MDYIEIDEDVVSQSTAIPSSQQHAIKLEIDATQKPKRVTIEYTIGNPTKNISQKEEDKNRE